MKRKNINIKSSFLTFLLLGIQFIYHFNFYFCFCFCFVISDYICDTDTFTTKACRKTFKIQSGILNCNSQKVVYLLKCRICGEAPYVGKAKTKFRARFNNYKSARRSYRKKRKVSQQRFHEHYGQHSHNGIDDWQFTLIEQCETHKQLKERETFWQHRLKTFYPYGLNEKKEYLY